MTQLLRLIEVHPFLEAMLPGLYSWGTFRGRNYSKPGSQRGPRMHFQFQNHGRVAKGIIVVLAVTILSAGFAKILHAPQLVEKFIGWHYPLWFMTAIGLIEITSAILLFTRFALIGCILIACVMTGAVGTHLMYSEIVYAVAPLSMLILDGILTRQLTHEQSEDFISADLPLQELNVR